jgi:hypothetical protein
MRGDNWTDETIPSRRVRPDDSEPGDDVQSDRMAMPARILGSVVVLLALTLCGLWSLYLLRGRMSSGGPTPTPVIWTPTPVPTSAASPLPPPTEMVESAPSVSPDIAIGLYVRVAGTGGYGLNLRPGPGENYDRVDVALEGEVFVVVDGPAVSGGSEWWKIRDPENEEREWWAVGNFLEPVEHP